MRKLLLLGAGILALLTPIATLAEVQLRIQMGFPAVLPPLVQVEPGVRVVQDFDEEIFFINGYYWVQRDGRWYRARDHRATWRYVEPRGLPPALVRHQPGQYRRFRHDEARTWPDGHAATGKARHWKTTDHQERRQGQEGHGPGHQEGQTEHGGGRP